MLVDVDDLLVMVPFYMQAYTTSPITYNKQGKIDL